MKQKTDDKKTVEVEEVRASLADEDHMYTELTDNKQRLKWKL